MGSAPQEPREVLHSGVYMQCQLSPSARLGTDTGETPKACRPASLTTTATNNRRCSFKHGGLRGPTPSWPWCSTPEAEASLVFRVRSKAAKGIKTVPSWGAKRRRRKKETKHKDNKSVTFLPISFGGDVVQILLQAYVSRMVTAAKAQQGPLSCCKYDEARMGIWAKKKHHEVIHTWWPNCRRQSTSQDGAGRIWYLRGQWQWGKV